MSTNLFVAIVSMVLATNETVDIQRVMRMTVCDGSNHPPSCRHDTNVAHVNGLRHVYWVDDPAATNRTRTITVTEREVVSIPLRDIVFTNSSRTISTSVVKEIKQVQWVPEPPKAMWLYYNQVMGPTPAWLLAEQAEIFDRVISSAFPTNTITNHD